MSISFSVSQCQQMQTLAVWLESAHGPALETAFAYQRAWTALERALTLYKSGRLPLSEVRKCHKTVCDFLVDAAKRHPGLRDF